MKSAKISVSREYKKVLAFCIQWTRISTLREYKIFLEILFLGKF